MARWFVSLVIVGTIALGGTVAAFAADCKQVRFRITNHRPTKVRLREIVIEGNKGRWTENIPNREIHTQADWTTGPQVLNKVDEGTRPVFMTVYFDFWDPANNDWSYRGQRFDSPPVCTDGRTYAFTLNGTN